MSKFITLVVSNPVKSIALLDSVIVLAKVFGVPLNTEQAVALAGVANAVVAFGSLHQPVPVKR